MSQVNVQALTGFEHNGTRNRGDAFMVSDQHAQALQARGLVKIVSATDEADQVKAAAQAQAQAARKAAESAQPTSRKRQSAQPKEPKADKSAAPGENSQLAVQSELTAVDGQVSGEGVGQEEGAVHTYAQGAGESPAAEPTAESDPAQSEA